jgi:carbon monoxide dehydrogenase subunit G
MQISSTKHELNAPVEKVITFLSDLNNIEKLLPKDKISEWKSDEDQCSFKVQNTATISLIKKEVSTNKIHLVSGEKSPFPFKLDVNVLASGALSSGQIEFDGEVNSFLKMMVERPLTSLFDYMSDKLKTEMEKS